MSRLNHWLHEFMGDPHGGPAYGKREDPATAAVLVSVSSAVSAIGAIQQGRAAKDAANYNAAIADQNATISRSNAAAEAGQIDRENYLRLGAIRAAQGHTGGASGAGSVLDVLGDVAAQGELEKQQALYQGELGARGYTNTAALDRASGRAAQTSSYFKAGSELLSGGANAYAAYSRLKNPVLTRGS